MTYDIEAFVRFLGNPMDGSQRTNIMYFNNGRQRAVGITKQADIDAAERFIKLNDGRNTLYVNLNPCYPKVTGKPKDSEIIATRNLLVDIDPIKAPGNAKHPATKEEIAQIPMEDINVAATRKLGVTGYVDFTGNGYRIIVNVKDATSSDQKNFVHLLNCMFPGYIDTNVIDPSRITGVPGTMNLKVEVDGRKNRRRDSFNLCDRVEVGAPSYSENEMAAILASAPVIRSKTTTKKDRPIQLIRVDPEASVQTLLNQYILKCSNQAPYVLKMIEIGPTDGDGFNFDGFFAAEIYNKVGDAPRVFATIMKAMWGAGYNARATQKAWEDCVDNGVGAWSVGTIGRVFGNSVFEAKQ